MQMLYYQTNLDAHYFQNFHRDTSQVKRLDIRCQSGLFTKRMFQTSKLSRSKARDTAYRPAIATKVHKNVVRRFALFALVRPLLE